jgi:hypothetical protein
VSACAHAFIQAATSDGPSYPLDEIELFEEPAAIVITISSRTGEIEDRSRDQGSRAPA